MYISMCICTHAYTHTIRDKIRTEFFFGILYTCVYTCVYTSCTYIHNTYHYIYISPTQQYFGYVTSDTITLHTYIHTCMCSVTHVVLNYICTYTHTHMYIYIHLLCTYMHIRPHLHAINLASSGQVIFFFLAPANRL